MMKKIGIWGFGVVGKSALNYFKKKKALISVYDSRILSAGERQTITESPALLFNPEHLIDFLEHNDFILPSPGVDIRPYSHYSSKWLSELDLFSAECCTPILAITGSVGKTTVTTVLAKLLTLKGKTVFIGGNIGVGLLESIEAANAAELVILEVSSFQLERSHTFAADHVIITNIHHNHLDRHESFKHYAAAKLSLVARQRPGGITIVPLALADTIEREYSQSQPLYFNDSPPPFVKSYERPIYFLHNNQITQYYQTIVLPISEPMNVPENFYSENFLVVALMLHSLGLTIQDVSELLALIDLPDHRLEKISTSYPAFFYNDSKATIPASTVAALSKLAGKPIIVIIGGISKGVDRQDFIKSLVSKVVHVICFGKEAEQLAEWCNQYSLSSSVAGSLDEVMLHLVMHIKPSYHILFSPAGASFDLYANYKERGDHFKKLITQQFK